MKQLPIIYSKNSNGSIQQWEIIIKDNTYYTREGLVDGKLTSSKPTIVSGKSIGRANETSDDEQTYLQAKRKWDAKIEKGYHENINDIDNESKYFEPMLAKKYLERQESVMFPVIVQGKCDGHRLVAMKNGLFTRNGKKYVSCPHISEVLKPLFDKHPDWIIDGEIYTHNESFEKICSLVKKTKPTQEDLDESKRLVQFWIFDGVVDDKKMNFANRYDVIKKEITNIVGKTKSLIFLENFIVTSHPDIDKLHDELVRQGFEGAIIRIIDSPYENKRSNNLLKYKKFFDEEYTIVDILEGTGNRSGMAGSIMLKTEDGKIFNSGIRGGEDYYKDILKNKYKYINKLATIRYQEKTNDGIPRFPIAVQVGREDI